MLPKRLSAIGQVYVSASFLFTPLGVGLCTQLLQNIFVSRDDVNSRQTALDTIKKRCQETGWRQIIVHKIFNKKINFTRFTQKEQQPMGRV